MQTQVHQTVSDDDTGPLETQDLLLELCRALVMKDEAVRVDEKCDGTVRHFVITCDDDDVRRLIGKDGSVVKAIRYLLNQIGSLDNESITVHVSGHNLRRKPAPFELARARCG